MTEKQKMLEGKLYNSAAEDLPALRAKAHLLCAEYNKTLETDEKQRGEIIAKLLPSAPKTAYIQGPIFCDYGENIYIGDNFYANFNLTILDCCPVHIGNDVFIGPNVSILTPVHPLRSKQRNMRQNGDGSAYNYEYAKPVTIGNDCWLGGNVTVIGGVTIGDGCVIGAGSVVTRDIPANSLAVGNPCRVIRTITEKDDLPDFTNGN